MNPKSIKIQEWVPTGASQTDSDVIKYLFHVIHGLIDECRCVWTAPVFKSANVSTLVSTSVIQHFELPNVDKDSVVIPKDIQTYLSRYESYLFREE